MCLYKCWRRIQILIILTHDSIYKKCFDKVHQLDKEHIQVDYDKDKCFCETYIFRTYFRKIFINFFSLYWFLLRKKMEEHDEWAYFVIRIISIKK